MPMVAVCCGDAVFSWMYRSSIPYSRNMLTPILVRNKRLQPTTAAFSCFF